MGEQDDTVIFDEDKIEEERTLILEDGEEEIQEESEQERAENIDNGIWPHLVLEENQKLDWETEKGRCFNCMELFDEGERICPHCGFQRSTSPKEAYHLYPGMVLKKRYLMGTVVGFGGFGILYRAWDAKLKTMVAIKEFYPAGMVNRVPGQKEVILSTGRGRESYQDLLFRFLDEARNTAKFNQSEEIVHVFDFFEENGTAYMVMEYLRGNSFKDEIRKSHGKVSWKRALEVIFPVIEALKQIHKEGIIHRDISPDNIFICEDKKVKLLDFGAARFSDGSTEKDLTRVLKLGFAPPEQYRTKSRQGPWTDIYAVGATLYLAVTGVRPEESSDREREDHLKNPKSLISGLPDYLDKTIMKAMTLIPEFRFQTAEEMRKALAHEKTTIGIEKELRFRKWFRRISIGAALLIIILGVSGGFWIYNRRRVEATLEGISLSLWINVENGIRQEEETRFTQALNEFTQSYPEVTLNISYIEEGYEEKLRKALQEGTGPDLFQSAGLGEDMKEYLADLKPLKELISLPDYYFLDNYEFYYPDRTKIPLGFDVTVDYINTLADGEEQTADLEVFLNGTARSYTGQVRDYYAVQAELSGYYQVEESDEIVEKQFCEEWSVRAASGEMEQEAAYRVLYYLLGENGQNALFILSHDALPVNKAIADVWWEVYGEMEFIKEELLPLFLTEEGWPKYE